MNFLFVKLEEVTSVTREDSIGILRSGMVRLWIGFVCVGWGLVTVLVNRGVSLQVP
jgi:hypothetical protein